MKTSPVKKLFYFGTLCLLLFEAANVYFIMPMPGSQRMESLGMAYFLYQWRWLFRGVFGAGIVLGLLPAFRASRLLPVAGLAACAYVAYQANFEMAAEKMFLQPHTLRMANRTANKVKPDKLVLGIERNGEAAAYPIQYLGYHHQVLDTVGGEPVMVTYCTVCRSGRVFSPVVNGRREQFRLVGMDHFNAMFEDAGTKTWWRQATGEAVAGPLKGAQLPEWPTTQTSLRAWLKLHPDSRIMQADRLFADEYKGMASYDIGLKRGKLTTTDTLSWNDKSWVVGILVNKTAAKAYDWNRLKKERIIHDVVGKQPVLIALAKDNKSFFAFLRPDASAVFSQKNDSLHLGEKTWNLLGLAANPAYANLPRINAYQEFWHSWRTFHPGTERY